MKIIQIAGGGDRGGAKTHIISLCSQLSRSCDLTLISLRSGDFAESAEKAGINTRTIFSRSTIADYIKLIKFIKKEKPDIVHCHGAKANISGVLIKLFCRCTIVSTIHSDYRLDYMHSAVKRNTIGRLNSASLRAFDYYITVSDLFKKMLIKRGFNANQILTIYNGLDFSKTDVTTDRAQYIRSYGLEYNEGDIVLGILARLNPVKDIPTLLYSFAKAKQKNQRLKLLIGGDGEDMEKLQKLTRELNITDSVAFLGWVDDVPRFFSVCDIDVLCSISESFPYSILEGIRGGCAVITSDVGGMRKLIDNGKNGYIFNSGDIDTFAKYITDLSFDSQKRKLFSDLLYEKASALYSLENMAFTQLNNYERIIKLKEYTANKKGVLVCGAYGRGNSGDEAILQAITDSVHSIDDFIPITVMTKKPLETSLKLQVNTVYTFNILKFMRAAKMSSLFINGGGNLIQDSTSRRSLWFYLLTIFASKKLGCKVIMYGCGIGHVKRKFNRVLTRKILDKYVDIITLRENLSKSELESMCIKNVDVRSTADPAMSIIPAPAEDADIYLSSNSIDPSGNYLCFSLRQWGDFSNYAAFSNAAEYAYEKYGLIPLFLPIELPRDEAPTDSVISSLKCPYHFLIPPEDPSLLISVFGKMKAVCAIRLHALVFAAASGAPFFAASYDIKVNGFMNYINKSDLCCNLNEINKEWLCSSIDKVVAAPADSTTELLRKLESGNVDAARELLQ